MSPFTISNNNATTTTATIGDFFYQGASTATNDYSINITGAGAISIAPNNNLYTYTIPDDARRGMPREFNKFINASDLLEEFIEWLGAQDIRQSEVMGLPLEYFIKWLVIRACEVDQEEPNVEMPALPAPKAKHRCLNCGQFMFLSVILPLHAGYCADRYFQKQEALALSN